MQNILFPIFILFDYISYNLIYSRLRASAHAWSDVAI